MAHWLVRGWRFRPAEHPPHGFTRLGAFVDGVYAIAATLLVLELRLPEEVEPGRLAAELAAIGPQYAAYAFGFLQMAGGWLQTRRLESWLRGVDHYATLLTLVPLGLYSLAPFTTEVLARSFADPRDLGTAVRLTAALIFAALVFWSLLLVYARRVRLFRPDLEPEVFTLYFRLGRIIWLVPGLAWLVSFAAPRAALALLVALHLLSLLPNEAHLTARDERDELPTTRSIPSA